MADTVGQEKDYVMRPWMMWSYRDLCANVGWKPAGEETFAGDKDGVRLEAVVSVFSR